jgi:coproporphyrinogen III oxidase-like Fe-S oxidoreductase
MQSADELSEAAKIAYQAFLDMSASKSAHFSSLEALDSIYVAGGVPSAVENHELEKLLATHDKNVLAFKTAIGGVIDSDEMKNLLRLMS